MQRCLQSSYFWTCSLYVLYCHMVVVTGIHSSDIHDRVIGQNHILLSVARVLLSIMFLMTWNRSRPWCDSLLLPDYLDLFASIWFVFSCVLYDKVVDVNSAVGEIVIRRIEAGAWFIELVASFGWVFSWYAHYMEEHGSSLKPPANKGWTLDDPDIAALLTNIGTSGIFFVMNMSWLFEVDHSVISDLLALGDSVFLFNAWTYFVVSLRDCDVLWFLPFHWGYLLTFDEIIKSDKEWNHYIKSLRQSKIIEKHSHEEVNGVSLKCSSEDE